MSDEKKLNENSTKAGNGRYIFDMNELAGMDAGPGYSSAHGPVVEGDRMQVGLINFPRGTGARPHTHPNEQWIYILKGKVQKEEKADRNEKKNIRDVIQGVFGVTIISSLLLKITRFFTGSFNEDEVRKKFDEEAENIAKKNIDIFVNRHLRI